MTVKDLKLYLDSISDDTIVVIRTEDPDVLLDVQIEEKNISLINNRPRQYAEDLSGNEGLILSPEFQRKQW